MAQLYNLKETYLVLIENIEIFNKLLDKSNFLIEKGKKSNDIRNSFLVSSYQDILDDFIDNKVEGLNQRESRKWRRVSEVLEYKHLVKRNLFSEGPKIDSLETFTIELSLLNIVKNIYQERAKPLNKTQYIDYENTIRTYKDYFENNYFKRTDDRDLQEKIESFENKLENISSEILKSIEALKYETSHNFKDKKTLGLEQTKSNYKKAKDLQDRYIIPLYRFTNVKTSSFMSMIDDIRVFLNKQNKLKDVQDIINHFFVQYIYVVDKIKPMKTYMLGYIKQTELNLNRNLGNEKLFNQIKDLIELNSKGNFKNNKIWTYLDFEEDINFFFENKAEHQKEKNIKKHEINEVFIDRGIEFLEENLENLEAKEVEKIYINKTFEEDKKKIEEDRKRRELQKSLLKDFNTYMKEKELKKDMELISYIEDFLNSKENFKNIWIIGDIQYLNRVFLNKSIGKVSIVISKEIKEISRFDKKVKYQVLKVS